MYRTRPNLDRRSWLVSMLLGAGAQCLPACRSGRNGALLGGFMRRPDASQRHREVVAASIENKRAFRIDLDRGSVREVESRVPIHVLEPHPLEPNLAIAASKRSQTASVIDWKLGKEARVLELPSDRYFYGHCAVSADGRKVLLSAYEKQGRGQRSLLLCVDVESFSIESEVPCPIGSVHDIVHLEGASFAIGGGRGMVPSFAVFDLETQGFRVLSGASGPEPTVASHLWKLSPARVLAVASRMGAESILGGGLVELDLTAGACRELVASQHPELESELLSFAATPSGDLVWFSVPDRRKLVAWNAAAGRLERAFELDSAPRSLSILAHRELVVAGTDRGFYAFDARTTARLERVERGFPFTRGAGTFCPHTRVAGA